MRSRSTLFLAASLAIAAWATLPLGAVRPAPPTPEVSLFVSGLAGGSGSTIGPGGALYVTEPLAGRISRVDPVTGDVTTFATGLPPQLVGLGGAMDIAFIANTAYVIVTLVGPDVGGSDVVGLYRIDGPDSFTVVADIGAFSMQNPPNTLFTVPTGVQYAMQTYRGNFLITDGHHNRVLHVTRSGEVTELIAFGNIVPTGIDIHGNTIYMAQAGPVPHLPENGRVVAFGPRSSSASLVASGARLLVDVERGRGGRLFALAQGTWDGMFEGSPALPNTGSLVEAASDGTLQPIVEALDRPTSFELIGDTAYVMTLGGEIWKVTNIAGPPYGRRP